MLPDFRPPVDTEMRALWRRDADPDVRRVILEVQHLRRVLLELEVLRAAIDTAWHTEVGGQLVALHQMRCRLQNERTRYGLLSAATPDAAAAGIAPNEKTRDFRMQGTGGRRVELPGMADDQSRSRPRRRRPCAALGLRATVMPIGRLRRRQRRFGGVALTSARCEG